ncbi:hypothetical protein [Nocardia testacea]|uniref:hypothetical protein n=1 Tax=Nocardia testacea TaxID=248551 RepID=UPI003A84C409
MSAPEMVLQYVNALKWPVVAVLAISLFHSPARSMLGQMQRLRVAAFGAEAEIERQALVLEATVDAVADEPASTPQVLTVQPESTPANADNGSPPIVRVSADVYAVSEMTDRQRAKLRLFLAELSEAASSSRSRNWVERRSREYPNGFVDDVEDEVFRPVRIINSCLPAPHPLWPGTPPGLVQVYGELVSLRDRAGGVWTPDAARAFYVGAKEFARGYSRHVEAALEAFDGLPAGASVELIN